MRQTYAGTSLPRILNTLGVGLYKKTFYNWGSVQHYETDLCRYVITANIKHIRCRFIHKPALLLICSGMLSANYIALLL